MPKPTCRAPSPELFPDKTPAGIVLRVAGLMDELADELEGLEPRAARRSAAEAQRILAACLREVFPRDRPTAAGARAAR